jgi:AcrR family transcriptional regulator
LRDRAHRDERRSRARQRARAAPETRREEFVDAAVAVIRRDGPNVSMDRVAAELGVTKPILYRHVGDRRVLARALAARFAEELTTELRRALTSDRPPRDLLVQAIDAYVSFVERDPNVYRFLVRRAAVDDPETGALLDDFLRHISQEVAVVLGEQLRAVGADSGAAEPWAYGLVGMVQLAGDWWLERRTMPRARLVEYLAALVWSGMAGLGDGSG